MPAAAAALVRDCLPLVAAMRELWNALTVPSPTHANAWTCRDSLADRSAWRLLLVIAAGLRDRVSLQVAFAAGPDARFQGSQIGGGEDQVALVGGQATLKGFITRP